uniref:Cytochrome c-552/4 domain-containing protein n=1 Tax=uncultured bacterium pAW1 TaxID=1781155 RepID=A0A1C9U4P9_9BACT|nr:hypothetical protein [uncultured bacterium pAW1]
MKKLMIAVALGALLLGAFAMAQEKVTPTYVGADKCKMCHKDIYEAWSKTKHATAFSKLSAEEAKKAECTGCHVTGAMADGVMIENVTCEACHGAGSEYKKPAIKAAAKWKADRPAQLALAKAAGLIVPTAENCVRCHKAEGNPNFKGFDFEKSKGLVHPVAAAAPADKK